MFVLLTRDKKILTASFASIWWDPLPDSLMQTILRNFVISLSIILSGLTINSMLIKLATLLVIQISMLTNNTSSSRSVYRSYLMRGKAITVAYLPMAKQEQANPTRWWVTDRTKESCLFHVNKFSIEQVKTKIRTNNMKLMFLCSKFITKEFKTC